MMSPAVLSVLLALWLVPSHGSPHFADRWASEEVLIFDEEFKDAKINPDVWSHDLTAGGVRGGNWEFQYYANNRSSSFIHDGQLKIQPVLTADTFGDEGVSGKTPTSLDIWGSTPADQCTSNQFFGCMRMSNSLANMALNPVTSARLRTVGSFSFKYGRLEVEAKLPKGDWLRPSIWLLPEKNLYGAWPASGEIDLVQSRGNAPGYKGGGVDTVESAIRFGPHFTQTTSETGSYTLEEGTFNDDFHLFGLVWNEKELYTYVDNEDNKLVHTHFNTSTDARAGLSGTGQHNPWKGGHKSAPFDEKFFLMIDVSVGGLSGYFPDGEDNKPWEDSDADAMMKFHNTTAEWYSTWQEDSALSVKSVRVWQKFTDYFIATEALDAVGGEAATTRAGESEATGGGGAAGSMTASGLVVLVVGAAVGFAAGGFYVSKTWPRHAPAYQSV